MKNKCQLNIIKLKNDKNDEKNNDDKKYKKKRKILKNYFI